MLSKIFSNVSVSCESVRRRFSEYVDGVLSQTERLYVHEHVGCCDECSDHLDEFCRALSLLTDFREECMPAAILNYRLPRSTFVEIFPTISKDEPPVTFGTFVPYVSALILLILALSTWNLWERHIFQEQYNASNYVEVVAKI